MADRAGLFSGKCEHPAQHGNETFGGLGDPDDALKKDQFADFRTRLAYATADSASGRAAPPELTASENLRRAETENS